MSTTTRVSDGKTVGYGGYGVFQWFTKSLVNQPFSKQTTITSGQYVFLTNASVSVQANRPMQSTYQAPRDTTSVSNIVLGLGTCNITGNISFDMSKSNIEYFLDQNKIRRNTYFNFAMSDGITEYSVYHCVWNSISFSANVGGLVSCNVSYTALNNREPEITTKDMSSSSSTYFDNSLVAYWDVSVGNYIQSFNLNFTQDVTPVYLNNDLFTPTYLRCGNINFTVDLQSWENWEDIDSIKIGNKTISFLNRMYNMKQYSHAGAADIGKHKFQISGVTVTNPTEDIFTIR